MNVPLEISFRNVRKTEAVESLIREKADDLKRMHQNIISCRVALEAPQQHQRSGRAYRVRVTLTVPQGHELVVSRDPGGGDLHDELTSVIRDAFEATRRQLQKLAERQRGRVKSHLEQEAMGLVVRLFREAGYGFLKTLDGREIYFHRNAVLHNDFDRLQVGTGVRFGEGLGEEGPQASTVQIVDKPGGHVSGDSDRAFEPPMGWGG
jgi:cold shock CspA family protein/ribosome-associated translation inhibitor RaiA